MKYLFLFCFTFFVLKNSFCQHILSGKIEDFKTNEPISNVSIASKDGKLLTISTTVQKFRI